MLDTVDMELDFETLEFVIVTIDKEGHVSRYYYALPDEAEMLLNKIIGQNPGIRIL